MRYVRLIQCELPQGPLSITSLDVLPPNVLRLQLDVFQKKINLSGSWSTEFVLMLSSCSAYKLSFSKWVDLCHVVDKFPMIVAYSSGKVIYTLRAVFTVKGFSLEFAELWKAICSSVWLVGWECTELQVWDIPNFLSFSLEEAKSSSS